MKKIILISIFLIPVVMSCTSQKKTLFYWGDYSNTLYNLKKTPNDENLAKHKNAIQAIITTSEKKKLKVPPGIYCEYGFILAKEGDTENARKYFELEAQTYPESAAFMEKLITNLNLSKEKP
jgi:hypothetical protein